MKISFLIAAILCLAPLSANAQELNNDTVLTLSKAGIGTGLIIEKINAAPCGYDVSINKIIALKEAGLSDEILAAMVRRCASVDQQRGIAGDDASNDPKVKHSPGIYLMKTWESPSKLENIRPSKSSGLRTTGNGSIIFPLESIMMIPGISSGLSIPIDSPIFYFYFNTNDAPVSDFGIQESVAAQSPDEFSLVRFKVKKDAREISMSKESYYEGSLSSLRKGVDPKYTVQFSTDEISKGIFEVSFQNKLVAGEYAFVFTGGNGKARIYDFSIDAQPEVQSSKKIRK